MLSKLLIGREGEQRPPVRTSHSRLREISTGTPNILRLISPMAHFI
jgi:hypothetical protein